MRALYVALTSRAQLTAVWLLLPNPRQRKIGCSCVRIGSGICSVTCQKIVLLTEGMARPHRTWYHQRRPRVAVFSLQGVLDDGAYHHTPYVDPGP